jgi:hypothetical protein
MPENPSRGHSESRKGENRAGCQDASKSAPLSGIEKCTTPPALTLMPLLRRIAAADHLAPVALLQAAKDLGRRRVFVACDRDDPDMAGLAADMRAAGVDSRSPRHRILVTNGPAGDDQPSRRD